MKKTYIYIYIYTCIISNAMILGSFWVSVKMSASGPHSWPWPRDRSMAGTAPCGLWRIFSCWKVLELSHSPLAMFDSSARRPVEKNQVGWGHEVQSRPLWAWLRIGSSHFSTLPENGVPGRLGENSGDLGGLSKNVGEFLSQMQRLIVPYHVTLCQMVDFGAMMFPQVWILGSSFAAIARFDSPFASLIHQMFSIRDVTTWGHGWRQLYSRQCLGQAPDNTGMKVDADPS